jgi:hypothetical protein
MAIPQSRNCFPPTVNVFPVCGKPFPLNTTVVPHRRNAFPPSSTVVPHNDNRIPDSDNQIPDNDNDFPVIGRLMRRNSLAERVRFVRQASENAERTRDRRAETRGFLFFRDQKSKTGSTLTAFTTTQSGAAGDFPKRADTCVLALA